MCVCVCLCVCLRVRVCVRVRAGGWGGGVDRGQCKCVDVWRGRGVYNTLFDYFSCHLSHAIKAGSFNTVAFNINNWPQTIS